MHQVIQVHNVNQVYKVIQVHKTIQIYKVNQVLLFYALAFTSKLNISGDRLFSGCAAGSRMAAVKHKKHKTPSAQDATCSFTLQSHNREWL